MSGMRGFHVSASGAIQGHHGPLVHQPFVLCILSTSVYLKWCCPKPFPKQALVFTCLQDKSFENSVGKHVGKGEIARNEQFPLFPLRFLPFLEKFLPLSINSKYLSTNSFGLEESKICGLGKG